MIICNLKRNPCLQAMSAAAMVHGDPAPYMEALASPDGAQWRTAMDEEIKSLVDEDTWTLCELPPGANLVGSKWVYTRPGAWCGTRRDG